MVGKKDKNTFRPYINHQLLVDILYLKKIYSKLGRQSELKIFIPKDFNNIEKNS